MKVTPENNNDCILDCHTILLELKEANSKADNASYQTLFTKLSEAIFILFVPYTTKVLGDLTNRTFSVNIEEVDDLLNETLLKIHKNIRTYHGTCNQQAQAWIKTIIQRSVLDVSKKNRRRQDFWKSFSHLIQKVWNMYGEQETVE